MTMKSRRLMGFIICIMTIVFLVNASVQTVAAVSEKDLRNDTSIYWKKGNNFYLMDYQPPIRYGKAFGKASDYNAKKSKKVIFTKTWKSNKSKHPILEEIMEYLLENAIPELGVLFDISTVSDMLKEDVRGVKVERTTYYNKHTKKYKVGKNRKCRKEVWKIYLKKKNRKTGKFSWKLLDTEVGYHSVITVD